MHWIIFRKWCKWVIGSQWKFVFDRYWAIQKCHSWSKSKQLNLPGDSTIARHRSLGRTMEPFTLSTATSTQETGRTTEKMVHYLAFVFWQKVAVLLFSAPCIPLNKLRSIGGRRAVLGRIACSVFSLFHLHKRNGLKDRYSEKGKSYCTLKWTDWRADSDSRRKASRDCLWKAFQSMRSTCKEFLTWSRSLLMLVMIILATPMLRISSSKGFCWHNCYLSP